MRINSTSHHRLDLADAAWTSLALRLVHRFIFGFMLPLASRRLLFTRRRLFLTGPRLISRHRALIITARLDYLGSVRVDDATTAAAAGLAWAGQLRVGTK